jgi:hypothetical protein
MTIEDFKLLKPYEQEEFINSGGEISAPQAVVALATDVRCGSSVGVEEQVEIPPTQESLGSPELSSTTVLSQPAIDLSGERSEGTPINESPIESEQGEQGVKSEVAGTHIEGQWTEGFDIKDPVELLFLLDDDIKSGATKLHPWQAEFMLDFALESHCKDIPFYAAVRAANGSGKDKYIVAACVVWLCMRYSQSRGVVTNGSGTQLDNQTEKYIRYLCQRANVIFAGGKELIWKCNYRYYECVATQSPIILFATDEPNKAEGYHPLKAGGKMAIFASEAKAIPDTIFTALTRCTGFTHRVDVSSPGLPMGYFYNVCTNSLKRKELKSVVNLPPATVVEYHITAFDCPHITPNEIRAFADKLPSGENDPVYKSGVLAEFTTTDEMVVIPYSFVHWAVNKAKEEVTWIQEPFNKAGLDLSDGGAETVLVVRNGNKHLKTIPFKFEDTQDTIAFLEDKFAEYGLTDKNALVFADCCGIGKPMIDALRRRGWSNMRYVDSRAKSSDKKVYFNRGTELFFNVRQLLERRELIVEYDKLLIAQMSGRYYKLKEGTVRQLLTKLEQRSRGYPSPDRADAFNLAFWDYKSTRTFTNYREEAPSEPAGSEAEEEKIQGDFSLKVWASDDKSSLASFHRNVSKKQPIDRLQRELERWSANRKN